MAINVETDKNNAQGNNYRVEGTHGSADFFPVFAQLVTSVGQRGAPDKGAGKSIDEELERIHAGDAGGKADKGAHHGQQSRDKSGPATPLLKPAVGHVQIVPVYQEIFPVFGQERTAPPHPHPICHKRAEAAAESAVSAGNQSESCR